MAQFVCPSCGNVDCNWPLRPGAAQPVAIVCDYTGGGGGGTSPSVTIFCDEFETFVGIYSADTETFAYYLPGDDGTLTPYVPDGTVTSCMQEDFELVKLYDDNGVFIRHFDTNAMGGYTDYDITGNLYSPVGTIYGEPQSAVPATLTDDGTPTLITAAFAIPADLRAFTIAVLTGPVTINGITVPTGFVMSREANPGELLPSFSIDGTGGQIIFDSIREV